jgi:hypothetical protein
MQVIVSDNTSNGTTGVICDNIAHHCAAIHEGMVKRTNQRIDQYKANKLCDERNRNGNNISKTLAQFKHDTQQTVFTTSLLASTPCTLSTFIDLLDTYKSCIAHRKQSLSNDIKRLSTAVRALDRAQALLQVKQTADAAISNVYTTVLLSMPCSFHTMHIS